MRRFHPSAPTVRRSTRILPVLSSSASLALALSVMTPAAAAGARAMRPPPVAPAPPPLPAPAGAPQAVAVAAAPTPLAPPDAGAATPMTASAPRAGPSAPSRPVRTSKLMLTGLMDRAVVGRDGGAVGHVIDVLVDPDGKPEALLVETGGFLGLGDRRIAVGWADASFPETKPDGPVKVNMTPDEVRAAPAWNGNGAGTIAIGPASPASVAGPPPVAAAPLPLPRPASATDAVPVALAPSPLAAPRHAGRSR